MSRDYSVGKLGKRRPRPQPSPITVTASAEPESSIEDGPVTLEKLPPYTRKAEAWAKHEPTDLIFRSRCHECNGIMWTWSDKEDICETCGFELRQRREEMRRMRDQKHEGAPRNAFERGHDQHVPVGIEGGTQRQVNPFQSEPVKPHAVGITTTRKFHNPFVR